MSTSQNPPEDKRNERAQQDKDAKIETKTPGVKMPYRLLGRSGLKVSALGFGSWVNFGKRDDHKVHVDSAVEMMRKAHDAGVNFFDNAEAYANGQSEEVMGEALQQLGWARKDYVITTKLFWGGAGPNDLGLSRKHIIEGIHASLKRLRLDYVDVVLCHRPDPLTPLEETARAMDWVINNNKALYWGTSEWSAAQIAETMNICERYSLIKPICEQPQYNMLHRERFEKEFAPLYDNYGLGTTIWSPLCMGLLTGKYNNGIPEGSRFDTEEKTKYSWQRKLHESKEEVVGMLKQLEKIAASVGCTMSQLAIAWCLKNTHVSTVLLGASKPAQLDENLGSIAFVDKLTDDVMSQCDTILGNKPRLDQVWRN